jgi:preprotein translocase subunit SecG
METFVAVVHIITALVLIALVLLQDSKSDGLGGAFGGGGSNSILGATGGATLAQKLTRGAAVVFAITSLSLTTIANRQTSVVENLSNVPATTPPAIPVDATTTSTTSTSSTSTSSTTTTTSVNR